MSIKDPLLLEILSELKIDSDYARQRGLPVFYQPELSLLEVVEIDLAGRPFILHKDAAAAWRKLIAAAEKDNVIIIPFSGFRSYRHQKNLIKNHLDRGRDIEDILRQLAVPGHSEHHTGCAVDLTTKDCQMLSEELEKTQAFKWLENNAAKFNFKMSFPRNNQYGFIYEPWHWCYTSKK